MCAGMPRGESESMAVRRLMMTMRMFSDLDILCVVGGVLGNAYVEKSFFARKTIRFF